MSDDVKCSHCGYESTAWYRIVDDSSIILMLHDKGLIPPTNPQTYQYCKRSCYLANWRKLG